MELMMAIRDQLLFILFFIGDQFSQHEIWIVWIFARFIADFNKEMAIMEL